MAAKESNEEETRLVVDVNDARMVLMVNETFSTAPAAFDNRISELAKRWSKESSQAFEVIKPYSHSGVTLYQIVPTNEKITAGDENTAVLVRMAYVVNDADNTVQHIGLYVNPKAAQDMKNCVELSNKIFKSLRSGTRKLNTSAGTRLLDVLDTKRKLSIELPKGFFYTVQNGPDFSVFSFTQLSPFEQNGMRLRIYVGQYPGYHYRRKRILKSDVIEKTGKLFGNSATWFHSVSKDDKGKIERHLVETIAPIKQVDSRLAVHVFFSAAKEKDIASLMKIIETLAVK